MSRELQIDKELMNNLFFELWDGFNSSSQDIKDDQGNIITKGIRFLSVYGGSGSGKSYSLTQMWILKLLEKKRKLLVLRQTSATLNDSCIAVFQEIMDNWDIPYVLNKSEKKITFNNGSTILYKGLDSVEKLKSIGNLWSIWIEEATELEQTIEGLCPTFDQVNARLRGEQAIDGKIVISFNPVSKSNWVYQYFHKDLRDDTLIFKSTYKDNRFLDEQYGLQLEKFITTNPLFYEIYCLGHFGHVSTGSEILKNFKVNTHVSKVRYNPEKAIIMAWDENVNPHLTLILAQVEGDECRVFDEICLKGKNLEEVCQEFNKKYKSHILPIIITGDATSRKQDAKLERGYNFYRLVQKYLTNGGFEHLKLVVPNINESVFMRSTWIDNLLSEDLLKVRVDPGCKGSITDLQECQWDATGTKINKEKVTVTNEFGVKTSMEKRGHHLDAFAYLLLYVWKKEYFKYKAGGNGKIASKFNNSKFIREGNNNNF